MGERIITHRIGERRYVDGPILDELFPGEQATPVGLRRDGDGWIARGWEVEPMPGLVGLWLRWRFRVMRLFAAAG